MFLDKLVVSLDPAQLSANTQWGILRGLESFSQSIYIGADFVTVRLYAFIFHYKHLLTSASLILAKN